MSDYIPKLLKDDNDVRQAEKKFIVRRILFLAAPLTDWSEIVPVWLKDDIDVISAISSIEEAGNSPF
tara:strand:- start:206 stop:406 length:201 start_codon:yes stop_codon:yes gene_type:complete